MNCCMLCYFPDYIDVISVVLWPPSASPLLQLMPIYGEASNHRYDLFNLSYTMVHNTITYVCFLFGSDCNIDNPDLVGNATAQSRMEYAQKIILHAGDALFIPEGW